MEQDLEALSEEIDFDANNTEELNNNLDIMDIAKEKTSINHHTK